MSVSNPVAQAKPQYPEALFLIRLKVENASIISSHLTWGMPAPSAFVGFGHALERKLNALPEYRGVQVVGVGVLCHQFHPQVTRTNAYAPYQLNLARHPVEASGGSAALLEEGKGFFEVTLLIGLAGDRLLDFFEGTDQATELKAQPLIEQLKLLIWNMRLAGGSVFPTTRKPRLIKWERSPEQAQKRGRLLYRHLLPSFALCDRSEILPLHQAWLAEQPSYLYTQGEAPNLLDTLLDLTRLNLQAPELPTSASDDDTQTTPEPATIAATTQQTPWQIRPRPAHQAGWLVALPVGYGALTRVQAAGQVTGSRDDQYPVCFVETLIGVGEWISPHRIDNLAELLWAYDAQPEHGLYRLVQPFRPDADLYYRQPLPTTFLQPDTLTPTEHEEF